MKKTILVIALALILIVVLAGCGIKEDNPGTQYDTGFRVLEKFNGELGSLVVYDVNTGVMYWINYHGGVTPIINADGSPRIWEGYSK